MLKAGQLPLLVSVYDRVEMYCIGLAQRRLELSSFEKRIINVNLAGGAIRYEDALESGVCRRFGSTLPPNSEIEVNSTMATDATLVVR
jgi:hypothetical protein